MSKARSASHTSPFPPSASSLVKKPLANHVPMGSQACRPLSRIPHRLPVPAAFLPPPRVASLHTHALAPRQRPAPVQFHGRSSLWRHVASVPSRQPAEASARSPLARGDCLLAAQWVVRQSGMITGGFTSRPHARAAFYADANSKGEGSWACGTVINAHGCCTGG